MRKHNENMRKQEQMARAMERMDEPEPVEQAVDEKQIEDLPPVDLPEPASPEPASPEPVSQEPTVREQTLLQTLRDYCKQMTSWPSDLPRIFEALQMREVFELFHDLNLRGRVYYPADMEKAPAWLQRAGKIKSRQELPRLLRAQMLHFLSRQPCVVRQRFMHVYQLHAMPEYMYRRAFNYYALTWLPIGKTGEFREGEQFVPLDQARAAVLSVRDHRFSNGRVAPMWDLKVLRFALEPTTHQILLGGHDRLASNGRIRNRCAGAWWFNYSPHKNVPDIMMRPGQAPLIDTGLDMHWAIEQACADSARRYPDAPEFPTVWLGFQRDDDAEIEMDAPGLQHQAWQQVIFWCQARRPRVWPLLPSLGRHDGDGAKDIGLKITNPGWCWDDVVQQIGTEDAKYLMLEMLAKVQVSDQHDGLHLLPLSFFSPGSKQNPIRKAVRAYLDFSGLVGREESDPRPEKPVCNNRLGKIQVIFLPDRRNLRGFCSDVTYDFLSVDPKISHQFVVAQ